jgi:hypothetical protein
MEPRGENIVNISRARRLPRVIFLEVCLLEFRDFSLCKIGIICGGFLEFLLNPHSCLIIQFLPDRPIIRTGMPTQMKCSWLTFNVIRGLMTSLSKISAKACCVLASAMTVSSKPQFKICKHVPLSRLSLAVSHAALVIIGLTGSNAA